ncbi:ABC transporter ATP-binding protein [Singulisphaera sp. PoT]|uniref:ABC transporter ATP-binding protein n=1 Tax=Singulisphaera sp. PoT TaxID=3411797 RepID=UPI003BF5CA1D
MFESDTGMIVARDVGLVLGGVKVLDGVDLEIRSGDFVVLVGPSGCGKTTLLRLLAGLLEPQAGEIDVDGLPPSVARRKRGGVSFVFQDPTLLPWRDAAANVRLPLELDDRGDPQDRDERVRATLALVGLTPQDFGKFPDQLSGGMKMRVAIARALVSQPRLLLLDEPFAALDDLLRQRLNETLLELWAEQRWAAVFVTHNMSEAVFLAQRIVMLGGRPATLQGIEQIPFAYPRSPSLRAEPEYARIVGGLGETLRRLPA